ncbi:hypothetical protein SH668x_001724 [Planctomicrobium sp. SH668]|uniref:hypothetical protein n=1 Tax=Planctomicrobium sp. SH668 TaxID=3448126 RepID=UPI003F5BAB27
MMNRILCFLDAPEVRRKRRKEALFQEMEAIDNVAGPVLQLWIEGDDEEGTAPEICWSISDGRPGRRFNLGFDPLAVAKDLRDFADRCRDVANKLEEGGK